MIGKGPHDPVSLPNRGATEGNLLTVLVLRGERYAGCGEIR